MFICALAMNGSVFPFASFLSLKEQMLVGMPLFVPGKTNYSA
jgi:hypothetical protein